MSLVAWISSVSLRLKTAHRKKGPTQRVGTGICGVHKKPLIKVLRQMTGQDTARGSFRDFSPSFCFLKPAISCHLSAKNGQSREGEVWCPLPRETSNLTRSDPPVVDWGQGSWAVPNTK